MGMKNGVCKGYNWKFRGLGNVFRIRLIIALEKLPIHGLLGGSAFEPQLNQ